MSNFVFTPYLPTLLTGPECPTPGTKDFTFKSNLNGAVNAAFRSGKVIFTKDEIKTLVEDANRAAGQNPNLVSLKMNYAEKEQWFVEVKCRLLSLLFAL